MQCSILKNSLHEKSRANSYMNTLLLTKKHEFFARRESPFHRKGPLFISINL